MKYVTNPKTGRVWVDMTGEKIGRWTVLELTGRCLTKAGLPQGQTMWKCQCECGSVKERVMYAALMNKTSLSCGCLRGEVLGAKAKTHGKSGSKVYTAWWGAKMRCHNPESAAFSDYGGRGIVVCDGLRENFRAWSSALGDPPTPKHSVDRRDVNGHYSCGQCSQCEENQWEMNIRWATSSEQANNTRANRRFLWKGEMMTLTNIARMEDVAFCSFRNLMSLPSSKVEAAVEYCRSRGLRFKERNQEILAKNPDATPPPPKQTRKPRKWALPKTERELRRYTHTGLKDLFAAAGVSVPPRKSWIDG